MIEGRSETWCGDCIHRKVCEFATKLTTFNKELAEIFREQKNAVPDGIFFLVGINCKEYLKEKVTR